MKVRFSNQPGEGELPSRIFGRRLREARKARKVSQTDLAERMTELGRPMNKAAILRIETGERGLALDEALALAQILWVPFSNLLEPERDQLVAVTNSISMDGSGLRRWLTTGHAVPVWPAEIKTQEDLDLAAAYLRGVAVRIVAAAATGDTEGRRAAEAQFADLVQRVNKETEANDGAG